MEFTIAGLVEATAELVPTRPAVVSNDGVMSYEKLVNRSTRLARYLRNQGLGVQRERSELLGHESGQDFLAQLLYNSPAYLEGLVGAFRARVAPLNINYRYVADELLYVLRDARPAAIQYHGAFAPVLAEILPSLDFVTTLLQVDDGSGQDLLPGAVDYEAALAASEASVDTRLSPDDLYVLYTGGTTGLPKGVLWRQADVVSAGLGVRNRRDNRDWDSLSERLAAIPRQPQRVMPLAPFMHGAAQWAALQALCEGNTVVIPTSVRRFDPAGIWHDVARHSVTTVTIVGDSFGRPLADAIEAEPRTLPALRYLTSGGAALSSVQKLRLMAAIPHLRIVETVGSSESGTQGRADGTGHATTGPPRFTKAETTVVVSEDMTHLLASGHPGTGWLATKGHVPLGYLNDPVKTARTFPVVQGQRLSISGDRARLLPGDVIELLGRDATTINTGGEKVYAEEVETILKTHPAVADAVVRGRPSEQWGSEVIAVVELLPGEKADSAELIDMAGQHLARYKLPKAITFVSQIQRLETGKVDFRWASEVVAGIHTAP